MEITNNIKIRINIQPGDLGCIMYKHGTLYGKEYGYGVSFETYVGNGLYEFYSNYDANKDRVWICELEGKIVGSLLLMHRENNTAQLRYFFLDEACRGLGVGNVLMQLLIDFVKQCGYVSIYLWTTDELPAAHHLYKKFGFVFTEEKESYDFGKRVVEQRFDAHF